MRITHSFSRLTGSVLAVAVGIAVAGVNLSPAQVQPSAYPTDKSTMAKSRAEQEAEQRVALSPDRIIELLRQEPGLLLQVQKMLVRKAYEQGRILDPEDLTEEALFQLLTEDHNICVLATREIEDRAYVRAKPTPDEMQRQHERDERLGLTRTVAPSAQKPEGATNNPSQENTYWEKYDASVEPYRTDQPQSAPPQIQPTTPAVPQAAPAVNNPQRQVEMTSLQQSLDSNDGIGSG